MGVMERERERDVVYGVCSDGIFPLLPFPLLPILPGRLYTSAAVIFPRS